MVGPFIFFDEAGPARFRPGSGIDVRPHPHIGISTVTYLFEGEIMHRDSLGFEQPIRPGAVNWMTAGRGIVHSERSGPEERARGSRLHGIQAWVALPDGEEETEPSFHHHPADSLPVVERDGTTLRLIAGSAYGETSPVTERSDLLYAEADLSSGAQLALPDHYRECAIHIVHGAVTGDDEAYAAGRMLVLEADAGTTVRAQEGSKIMILGGNPPSAKRHIWWNFVSSSPARIEQAKRDWKAGKFAEVPGETESIPLPLTQ